MNLAPRPHTAPALVAGCWTLSVLTGATLVAIGPTESRPEPDSLSPYSLAAYLRGVADPTRGISGSSDLSVVTGSRW